MYFKTFFQFPIQLKIVITLLFTATIKPVLFGQRTIQAHKTISKIEIDGALTEQDWKTHLEIGNFTQQRPNNGEISKCKTEIGLLYDAHYLYVMGVCHVTAPSEITRQFTERDDSQNTDFFAIQIDPFGNAKEGYDFTVTTAGVQADEKLSEFDGYPEFNAVWESDVKLYEDKWIVEMKIPFNSIRFPKENLDQFKVNFQRVSAVLNEESFWNPIDPVVDGFLNQFGNLKGIDNIAPPLNLSLYPFTTLISENAAKKQHFSLTAGMDLKYVHKNAFTLDVSLIPDFSQAQSDDQVFNISPFEIQYNENRQFFIEGTELFDKGGYLYTRRIGGEPILKDSIELSENEDIITNPTNSNVLSLLKITGKTKNGLSVGVLNGMTAKSEAKISNSETKTTRMFQTSPLINYNSLVLDQTFKNNSSITLINNLVLRDGADTDVNLTAFLGRFYLKDRTFSAYFKKAFSQKYHAKNGIELGHHYFTYLSKISGKWTGGISANLYDNKFDPNDFGYLNRNNQFRVRANIDYRNNNPKKVFSRYFIGVDHSTRYHYSTKTHERSYYKVLGDADIKKLNHTLFASLTYISPNTDFYEARTKDRYFIRPAESEYFIEYQTNRNKNVFFAGYFVFVDYLNSPIFTSEKFTGYGITTRLGSHLNITFEQDYSRNKNSVGYLTSIESKIILGERDLTELTNSINVNYSINSKVNISARLRHYWIQVAYDKHYDLQQKGTLILSETPIEIEDDNFNAFTINVLAKWQFAPGSEVSLSYKLGADYYNTDIHSSYFDNLKSTVSDNNRHTFSLKVLYYMDVNRLRNRQMKL